MSAPSSSQQRAKSPLDPNKIVGQRFPELRSLIAKAIRMLRSGKSMFEVFEVTGIPALNLRHYKRRSPQLDYWCTISRTRSTLFRPITRLREEGFTDEEIGAILGFEPNDITAYMRDIEADRRLTIRQIYTSKIVHANNLDRYKRAEASPYSQILGDIGGDNPNQNTEREAGDG